MNKVASTGRLDSLHGHEPNGGAGVYYTYHAGDQSGVRVISNNAKRKYSQLERVDSESDSLTEERDVLSRFKVAPVVASTKRVQAITTPGVVIPTNNMFGVLDNSVHEYPTPVKVPQAVANGHLRIGNDDDHGVESSDGDCGGSKRRNKLKLHHRSKSTSPQRVGEAAKQKDMFKHFDPEKAGFIRK